ncbi:MAG: hypothetical protein ACHP9Z_11865 [Streptosporangiales bacterium]
MTGASPIDQDQERAGQVGVDQRQHLLLATGQLAGRPAELLPEYRARQRHPAGTHREFS